MFEKLIYNRVIEGEIIIYDKIEDKFILMFMSDGKMIYAQDRIFSYGDNDIRQKLKFYGIEPAELFDSELITEDDRIAMYFLEA